MTLATWNYDFIANETHHRKITENDGYAVAILTFVWQRKSYVRFLLLFGPILKLLMTETYFYHE